ncbi:unnamed protein product [Closterium sp. NIES-54]
MGRLAKTGTTGRACEGQQEEAAVTEKERKQPGTSPEEEDRVQEETVSSLEERKGDQGHSQVETTAATVAAAASASAVAAAAIAPTSPASTAPAPPALAAKDASDTSCSGWQAEQAPQSQYLQLQHPHNQHLCCRTPLLVSPPVTPDPPGSPLPATPSWHALPPPCLWSFQVSASPPCLPCIEGRQSATPHSSSFPLTTAPLQTLHKDVWGPTRVTGLGHERYFLLVVDDYTRCTVFPLRCKGQVVDVLIPWIRAVRLQLRERFHQDLPVLRLLSDRGGEFSSDLLREFCRGEGILQSIMLPDSPQQNGIDERCIGLVMEVARTSIIHAAPPHILWPFAVFRVWGTRVFVRDTSADKLSARAIPCVLLGFVPDAPGWQFYHPTSRRVFPSQDVTFDASVPFYHLFPYRSAPPPPPPLFLAPGQPPVDPLTPQGPAPSRVSQVDPLLGSAPAEVAVGSGAASGAASAGVEPVGAESEGAESKGAESGGAECGGAEPGGAKPVGVEPVGAESEGAESGGAEQRGRASSGGLAGASPRLYPRRNFSPHSSCVSGLSQRTHLRSGAARAGDIGVGGAGVTAEAGGTGGTAAAGPGGARTRGYGAAGTGGVGGAGAGDPTELGAAGAGGAGAVGAGAGGTGAGGIGAGGARAGGAGGTVQPRPYFVPLLQQVLGVPSYTFLTPPLLLPPDQTQPLLQPATPVPAPSPYTEKTGSLTERREPASPPASLVRTGRRVPRSRAPLVPGTHTMELRPSSVTLRVPLLAPPESSFLAVPDLEPDRARAASPTVSHLLATFVTDPSFESTAASALVAELVDFAAACRLDYATAIVAESSSACPPSVRSECALGTDVVEDRQEDFESLAAAVPRFAYMQLAPEGDPDAPDIPTPHSYAEAITGPYSSQWQAAMDAEMES